MKPPKAEPGGVSPENLTPLADVKKYTIIAPKSTRQIGIISRDIRVMDSHFSIGPRPQHRGRNQPVPRRRARVAGEISKTALRPHYTLAAFGNFDR